MKANIYIPCPDARVLHGGHKTIYRQAEVLQELGYAARVVHRRTKARLRAFRSSAEVITFGMVSPRPDDILVLPDIYRNALDPKNPNTLVRRTKDFVKQPLARWLNPLQLAEARALAARFRRIVILNLNAFNVLRGISLEDTPESHPFRDPRVEGMIVVSRQNEELMRLAFPDLPIHYYHKSVDPDVFRPNPAKRAEICLFPRKRHEEISQVVAILKARGSIADFQLTPMHGLSEDGVAEIMGRSRFFFSFSSLEGLPRPPMEAMMAGCIVIGFHGQGGKDYMRPEFAFPVESEDVVSFVHEVERALAEHRERPEAMDAMADRARAFVSKEYSPEREKEELRAIWSSIV